MKSVNWQNGQRIIKQVLDWFSTAKDSNDKEARQDYQESGLLLDMLNDMDIIVGTNNTPSTPSVTVRSGIAYDSAGDRIVIDNETLSYDATNPSDTTDNGFGVFVPTPHSTGSLNIPLTTNSMNYLWIDYLATIDETVFTLQSSTNAKQFYKQTDGYNITVTTVNTPPTATSVYLGSVNLTGFGVVSLSTISTTGRTYSLLRENRVKIKTPLANLSDATPSYTYNTQYTLDEHIKAVGTGTVTAQNPHGTSAADIGIDVENIISTHQKFMHNNGIIGDRTSTTGSLYLELHAITPGDDFVVIKALTSSEVANVDGITVTSSDIPSDVTFLFSSSGDLTGTYYIYLDKFTQSLIRTTTDPSGDATKLPLWSMLWTQGITPLFDGNLTNITDLRIFGTINNDKIDNKDTYDLYKVRLEDGTVSSPALVWQSDLDTGIYRIASNTLGFTANSAEVFRYSAGSPGGIEMRNSNVFFNTAGSVGVPAYTFATDPDTGIYLSSSGTISFTSNGLLSANISGGQVAAVNGSVGTPAYSFLSDTNTGFYGSGSDVISTTLGGTLRSQWVANQFQQADGTVSLPGFSFLTDTDTGMYRSGSGALSFSSNGTNSATISGTQLTVLDGTSSVPSVSFISDSNTGLFKQASDILGVTAGGTESIRISSTQVLSTYTTSNSFPNTPAYAFTAQNNSGMGIRNVSGSNRLIFLSQGLIGFELTASAITSVFPFQEYQSGPTTPPFTFTNDTASGMYQQSSNTLSFATSSTNRMTISTTAIVPTLKFQQIDGNASNPAYGFSGGNVGLYRDNSTNHLHVAQGLVSGADFYGDEATLAKAGGMGTTFKLVGAGSVAGTLATNTVLLNNYSLPGYPAILYAAARGSGTNYSSLRSYMYLPNAGGNSLVAQLHEVHAGFDNINRADIYLVTAGNNAIDVLVSQFTTSGHEWAVYYQQLGTSGY